MHSPAFADQFSNFIACVARSIALTAIALASATFGSAALAAETCTTAKTITAYVAAIEQQYTYNRFGAYNPGGMMYALRRDIVAAQDGDQLDGAVEEAIPPRPDAARDKDLAGNVRLRSDKRPRPLVLRINEGDCLKVIFTNLLSPSRDAANIEEDPENGRFIPQDSDEPATRSASMHVNGLDYRGTIGSDGANIGRNQSSLAVPGETKTYLWYGKQEGTFLLYSMAAPAGGEGDGGQLGLGLFGAVNVEPSGSVWYRSQVTKDEMQSATVGTSRIGTPLIDFDGAKDPGGTPLLAMLKSNADGSREIVHSDLNAVVKSTPQGENCAALKEGPGSTCGRPFREFTVIFHDELTAVQAFRELDDEDNPLSALKDGMGINYGSAGLGAMVLANRKGVGPAKDCIECKAEEFFLTSWAMGDPALLVQKGDDGKPHALFPDDPSNVHHSYLGDPIRFRNIHAGPKETHVFHLHAHQWVQDWHDPNSVYLDSQTVSPGGAFTYSVHYGGSGNRNLGPGDSIFHCHLYPHFAEGMWELWRTHDVFEAGTPDRNLPDGEIAEGTPNPALVPLPDVPLPPMPTTSFKGFPFYIAGVSGHRPPQAPGDIEEAAYDGGLAGTLGRHVVVGGDAKTDRELGLAAVEKRYIDEAPPGDPVHSSLIAAQNVWSRSANPEFYKLASTLKKIDIRQIPEDGTVDEKVAIAFHGGQALGSRPVTSSGYGHYDVPRMGYPSCAGNRSSAGTEICDKTLDAATTQNFLFEVNGQPAKPGAPFSDPCPVRYGDPTDPLHPGWRIPHERIYSSSYVQFDMPVNRHGWHDPQARIIVLDQDVKATLDYTRPAEPFFFRANSGDCVTFKATNLIPSNLNLDDFQVFSPTDTIGQHIHLVKFDVTASDGSANGWNYEDGTLSPDEVRERIIAYNNFKGSTTLRPKTHRLFRPGGPLAGDSRGICPDDPAKWQEHPWCGAQTTIQRWWADPLLNNTGHDRTIRTVFTHDHMGPSSHQHHGFYAALVVEPRRAEWRSIAGEPFGGVAANGQQIAVPGRNDGGPTSFAANIIDHGVTAQPSATRPDMPARARREYNLAVADFGIVYTRDNKPVNPPGRLDHELPTLTFPANKPAPEGISSSDPGGQLFNYRNEPIPLRIGSASSTGQVQQKPGAEGDMANVFSSTVHANQPVDARFEKYLHPENCSVASGTICTEPPRARQPGDSALPLITAYEGDRLMLRLIQGAQEENHIFQMNGAKWLSQPESPNSGWRAAQHIGISEHFEFDVALRSSSRGETNDRLYRTSAVDNLWDGIWGIMRSYRSDRPQEGLATLLPDIAPPPFVATPSGDVCNKGDGQDVARVRSFEVEAWRAKDLLPQGKLVTNQRRATGSQQWPEISDANAIVYVVTDEKLEIDGDAADPRTGMKIKGQPRVVTSGSTNLPEPSAPNPFANRVVDLRNGNKAVEPLVLRARAGECIKLGLSNKLTPIATATAEDIKRYISNPANWSYNMLPPIIDGFNFNQVVPSSSVGLTPQLIASDVRTSDGSAVGLNEEQLVEPGTKKIYTWYAGDRSITRDTRGAAVITHTPIEFGVVGLQDMADVITHASHGGFGSLVIEPKDASWRTDCEILAGANVPLEARRECLDSAATVTLEPGSSSKFREFVLALQNDASLRFKGEALANLRNGDDAEDSGQKTFNYRHEPFWQRLNANPAADPETMMDYDYSNVLSSWPICKDGLKRSVCPAGETKSEGHGDPATPLFTTQAGLPVRFRLVEPAGHARNHAFTLFGHDWIDAPARSNLPSQPAELVTYPSYRLSGSNPFSRNRFGSVTGIGSGRHVNLLLDSAGGSAAIPGDYLYRTQEGFTFGGGLWGIMRVIDPSKCGPKNLTAENTVCK